MIDILANIIKIIVLSSSSDALLSVDSSLPLGHVTVGVNCPNKDRLELIHASVGKQERGVVQGDGGGGVDVDVLILKQRKVRASNTTYFITTFLMKKSRNICLICLAVRDESMVGLFIFIHLLV